MSFRVVREEDPLKQGLKPKIIACKKKGQSVREEDPLKQGLKQESLQYGKPAIFELEKKIH